MDDLIRRSDAIKAMAKAIGHIVYDAEAVSQHVMNSIPAVEPKQEWIPCEERLPEKPKDHPEWHRDWYLVSLTSGCVESLGFDFDSGKWHSTASPVVAWMPLPEPYMKGADDE